MRVRISAEYIRNCDEFLPANRIRLHSVQKTCLHQSEFYVLDHMYVHNCNFCKQHKQKFRKLIQQQQQERETSEHSTRSINNTNNIKNTHNKWAANAIGTHVKCQSVAQTAHHHTNCTLCLHSQPLHTFSRTPRKINEYGNARKWPCPGLDLVLTDYLLVLLDFLYNTKQ